ncbi:MAG: TlpA family protein disulfide reductase [Lachnospiraceae bacterium]|nr:TlpA family protein disulfide reductase [Lachnospiraceae bacterium]
MTASILQSFEVFVMDRKMIRILAAGLLGLSLCACGVITDVTKAPETKETQAPAESPVTTQAPAPMEAPSEVETETEAIPSETQTEAAPLEADIRFTTVDMDGNTVTEQDFAGAKLTMINCWAYWCGPCVGEMPDLEKLYEEYRSRGFMLWGISDEEYEALNKETIQSLGITYPCLRYTPDFDEKMQTGYIPTTIFVNAEGKVVGETYIGSRGYEDWKAIIEELLP